MRCTADACAVYMRQLRAGRAARVCRRLRAHHAKARMQKHPFFVDSDVTLEHTRLCASARATSAGSVFFVVLGYVAFALYYIFLAGVTQYNRISPSNIGGEF